MFFLLLPFLSFYINYDYFIAMSTSTIQQTKTQSQAKHSILITNATIGPYHPKKVEYQLDNNHHPLPSVLTGM
jgi:hypothetical protein